MNRDCVRNNNSRPNVPPATKVDLKSRRSSHQRKTRQVKAIAMVVGKSVVNIFEFTTRVLEEIHNAVSSRKIAKSAIVTPAAGEWIFLARKYKLTGKSANTMVCAWIMES